MTSQEAPDNPGSQLAELFEQYTKERWEPIALDMWSDIVHSAWHLLDMLEAVHSSGADCGFLVEAARGLLRHFNYPGARLHLERVRSSLETIFGAGACTHIVSGNVDAFEQCYKRWYNEERAQHDEALKHFTEGVKLADERQRLEDQKRKDALQQLRDQAGSRLRNLRTDPVPGGPQTNSPCLEKGSSNSTMDRRPRKKRGRPPTSLDKDRRIAEAWDTGRYRTEEQLAIELGLTTKDVHDARERVRKRRKNSSE